MFSVFAAKDIVDVVEDIVKQLVGNRGDVRREIVYRALQTPPGG